jgi:hypothetical protein
MGCISIEVNYEKKNNGDGVNNVGESGNESIIDAKDDSHAKKPHDDPLGLLHIEGVLLEIAYGVSGAVYIYQTYETYGENQQKKRPVKIEKQTAVKFHIPGLNYTRPN